MSELTYQGITVSSDQFTLFNGTFEIQIQDPDTIQLPAKSPEEHAHIVLGELEYTNFIQQMNTAPVRKMDVSVYDQSGNNILKYQSFRHYNRSGNVRYSSSCSELLSHMILPKITEGSMYLVLTSLPGLNRACDVTNRRMLFQEDLKRFRARYDTSSIHLYLSEELSRYLSDLDTDMTSIFQSVTIQPQNKLISYLIEYLMGLNINGSKAGFEGLLEFSPEVRIIKAVCQPVTGYTPITGSIRSDGIAIQSGILKDSFIPYQGGFTQETTDSKFAKMSLLVVVEHKKAPIRPIQMTERETNTTFILSSLQTDVSRDKFLVLLEEVQWYEQLQACANSHELDEYKDEVYRHLFHTPLNNCESWSKRESDQMIIQYATHLRTETQRILYRMMKQNDIAPPPPPSLREMSRHVSCFEK